MKSSSYSTSSNSALSVSSTVFLARFFMSLRSDISSTDTIFADTARAPFINDLLFSRWKSYAGALSAFRYAVVNLRKKLCVARRSSSTPESPLRQASRPTVAAAPQKRKDSHPKKDSRLCSERGARRPPASIPLFK